MDKKVDGVTLHKWTNLEIDEFRIMVIGMNKIQKDSLATSLKLYYEVLN